MPKYTTCNICLEKKCKATTEEKCDCSTCKIYDSCPRKLRAIIRVTLKCTQKCKHCCFDCTPQSEVHMSVETAKKIAQFIRNNFFFSISIMGGEIFCNPDWKKILYELSNTTSIIRLVSNSDWASSCPEFADEVSKYKNMYVSLSKDKYHTNTHVELAEKLLLEKGVKCIVCDLEDANDDNANVPIGRARLEYTHYSAFSCYCHNPEKEYVLMIDEVGDVFKCGFGVWDYANVDDYLEGGFPERFKEFGKLFNSIFISNCASCIRGFNNREK